MHAHPHVTLKRSVRLTYQQVVHAMPPAARRRWLYFRHHGRMLSLKNPQLFSEKINWRMVFDRRDILALSTDKLRAKEYAQERGVRVARTIWRGTDVLEFEQQWRPETGGQWVLKPNFSSGHVCFGEGEPNGKGLQDLAEYWLSEKSRAAIGEWSYGQANRVLLAEERLGTPGAPIKDYKFFVFKGEIVLVRVDRATVKPISLRYYRADWTPTDFREGSRVLAPVEGPPEAWDEMRAAAKVLGGSFDFIRVDLYDIGGFAYFGELTPYSGGGLKRWDPRLEQILGDAWTLPSRDDLGS